MSARNADRRTPRSAALRRLVMVGNLLAERARSSQYRSDTDLANVWDSTLDALRADLAEPRCYGDIPGTPVGLQHFNCSCALPESTS